MNDPPRAVRRRASIRTATHGKICESAPLDQKKLAEAAKAMVELQPWLESLEEGAFSKYAATLERDGRDAAARTERREEGPRGPGRAAEARVAKIEKA